MIHASDAETSDYRDVGIEGRLDEGHVDFETMVDTTKVVVVVGVVGCGGAEDCSKTHGRKGEYGISSTPRLQ